jgi:DNA-binding NarL/FixJ family response regulator
MQILVADDQPKVRLALRLLLEQESGLTVVAEAAEADGLLAQVGLTRPDLVLLDWGLSGGAEGEQLSALRRAFPGVAVIVLSAQPGAEEFALAIGADAFVSKGEPAEELLTAIRALA